MTHPRCGFVIRNRSRVGNMFVILSAAKDLAGTGTRARFFAALRMTDEPVNDYSNPSWCVVDAPYAGLRSVVID